MVSQIRLMTDKSSAGLGLQGPFRGQQTRLNQLTSSFCLPWECQRSGFLLREEHAKITKLQTI